MIGKRGRKISGRSRNILDPRLLSRIFYYELQLNNHLLESNGNLEMESKT